MTHSETAAVNIGLLVMLLTLWLILVVVALYYSVDGVSPHPTPKRGITTYMSILVFFDAGKPKLLLSNVSVIL